MFPCTERFATKRLTGLAAGLVFAVLLSTSGCQREIAPPPERPATVSETSDVDRQAKSARRVAIKAQDVLMKTLSGRLAAVVQSDGPVAAINVCKDEATPLTQAAAERHGVEMGRIGVRLRNPLNEPPAWAKPSVDSLADEIVVHDIEGSTTGVLLPIHLKAKCITCHGTPDQIPDAIAAKLDQLYPNDEARGFAVGQLRGWVWVKVPAMSLPHGSTP